jgi:large subunit ribosomal protein L24
MNLIKKNDKVKVTCGKDKGRIGNILKVLGNKVLVKDINFCKKHTKSSKSDVKGGIVNKEMFLDRSNVMHCSKDNTIISRVGIKIIGNDKVRYLKKNGQSISAKVS